MYDENEFEETAPWLVIIITLIGGFLRVYQLDIKGLWLDETFSIWMAQHSVVDLLQWTIKIDQHPPYIISCSITGSRPMGIRPMMPACFPRFSAQAPSRLFT